MDALLVMPSQYDNLISRLDSLSEEIHDVREAVRNNEEHLRNALYGGNGDGPGIFERFRNLFDWREEHISSHEHSGQERRSAAQDWRRFSLDVAKQALSIFVVVIAVLVVFAVTGKVVSFP